MFYGLRSQLKSHVLSWKSKIVLYKILIRPVLTYASETWVLSTYDENALAIFEGKVLRSIYGPIKDSSEWTIRYSYELYALCEDMDIITLTKVGRLKWAGHVARMDQQRLAKRILNAKPKAEKQEGLN
jgi:hypothetical protein